LPDCRVAAVTCHWTWSHRLDALLRFANNEGIVRTIALALGLALQAASFATPFVHAHPDNHATAHHAGRLIHAHRSEHAAARHAHTTPTIRPGDHDQAIFLNIFTAVSVEALFAPAVTPAVFELIVPAQGPAHLVLEVTHGLDPPSRHSLPTRAPPALLS
jgi:hypothetical protein